MDVRLTVPADVLRDPEIARRVRDFRHEERLRHALVGGGAAVAVLACVTRGPLLRAAAAAYLAAAACWTVRLERMLTRGMYESFHALECAVWARVGRLRVRERDVEVLHACADAHALGRHATLPQLYELAQARRGTDERADAEFREVADAVYRFLVVHRFAVTDAVLMDQLPRAALFLAALALLAGGGAALIAAGHGPAAARIARLAVGAYLVMLARGVDGGSVAAVRQAFGVAAAALAWGVLTGGGAGFVASPLAFAGVLWYGRRALERE